ncbi:MAG: BatA domain-containing protein [Pseudomonadota bacterium]
MSPVAIALLGVVAGILTIAIHWLFRGARKTLEVATLEPFGDLVRPRLRLTRLHEPLLLLLRLLLLSMLVVALLTSVIDFERERFGEQVVLVTPNLSSEVARSLLESGSDVRWLDANLTPVARPPVSADWVQALLDADRKIPMSSEIRVTGWAAARDWPLRAPVLRREIQWEWLAEDSKPVTQLWPEVLQVVVGEDLQRFRAERAFEVWKNYGLLDSTEIRWLEVDEVSADYPVIWWQNGAPPSTPFGLAVANDRGDLSAGWEVVAPPSTTDDNEFASRLWNALIAFESARPVPAMPARLSAEINPDLQSVLKDPASDTAGLSGAWWLIALLFGLERFLAARAARR